MRADARVSLLTGRHYHRTGVWGVHAGRDELNRDETLLPEVLRGAGYRTGMIGKWHNGKTSPFLSWNRGFEEAWSKGGLYNHASAVFMHNGERIEKEGWTRDAIGELAIDFMREQRGQPFFLYVAFPTPHPPPTTRLRLDLVHSARSGTFHQGLEQTAFHFDKPPAFHYTLPP